ncbi:hypothetical protein CRG49_000600 [Neisseria sp. N95_16]|uniref:Uncharacterized protein n=1 Tax=Neisseria brasiliensis TaxID=2666100 RepID=A0A7X2H0T6_9NEIS|nr:MULTISPECIES: hypothetical protein [Neisseria]MRN38607.1 hypothetical protein [Neisseria brasiliensis]PJO10752.1 hypothetical protein CRG49_000600 [Neisseria sp. N95_16]
MARTVKISVSTKKRNPRAVNLLVNRLTKNAEDLVLEAADAAIEAAVNYTPKWSGTATAGWIFTTDKNEAYQEEVANEDLNFPEGIKDLKAAALNRMVIAEAKSQARQLVKSMLKKDKRVQMYLVNTVAHSEYWLAENPPINWTLRHVNSDYYTLSDITREASLAYSLKSADLAYKRFGWS